MPSAIKYLIYDLKMRLESFERIKNQKNHEDDFSKGFSKGFIVGSVMTIKEVLEFLDNENINYEQI